MSWGMVAVAGASLVGSVVGSKSADKSASAQNKANELAASETRRATNEARSDINRLFPLAQQAGQQGFQSAMDVFGQSAPQQAQAFQGGNVAAQQQILAGLPQIQNALMGNQIDYSQFQPYQAQQPSFNFMNQTLPFFQQQQNQEQAGQMGPFLNQPTQRNPLAGNFDNNKFVTPFDYRNLR